MESMRTEFEQYRAMRAKMSYLQEQLINAPVVCDTVSGSSPEWPYTKQCMAISGVDGPKVAAIRREAAALKLRCEAVENAVEKAPNIRMGIILRMRYIDGAAWEKVAECVPGVRGEATEDGVRKMAERYLDSLKK